MPKYRLSIGPLGKSVVFNTARHPMFKVERIDGGSNAFAGLGLSFDVNGNATPAAMSPVDADYLVKTANAGLSAERVVTDTTTITWDWSTAGQAKANRADLTGDVTTSGNAATIAVGAVTEAKQTLADNTTGNVSTARHGYVPKAPADATKFLDGTGAWSVPPDTGITQLTGDVTASGSGSQAATIAANAVTYAKIQQVSNNKVLGNTSGGTANVSEIPTTGSGNAVLATSPTLVTPALGTPSSGSLGSCTGYTAANVASGHGTTNPTPVNVANAGTLSARLFYVRQGGNVAVSGFCTYTPAAGGTLTQIGIPLPIAADINNTLSGSGTTFSGSTREAARIVPDNTNDRAQLEVYSVGTSAQTCYFSFQYVL